MNKRILYKMNNSDEISKDQIIINFYKTEDYVNNVQKRRIGYILKNANDDIVKEVKKLYQIYNILFQTKKIITRNQDFNDEKSINDFYEYLSYNVNILREEIYKYIMLIQDDDFDNNEIVKNRINYYSEHKSIDETLYND